MGKTSLSSLAGSLVDKYSDTGTGGKGAPGKNKIRENCAGKNLPNTQTGKKSETGLKNRLKNNGVEDVVFDNKRGKFNYLTGLWQHNPVFFL